MTKQSINEIDETKQWIDTEQLIDGTEQSINAMNESEQSIALEYDFEAIDRISLWI